MSDRKVYMKTTRECYEALLAGKILVCESEPSIEVSLNKDDFISASWSFDDSEVWYIKPEPRVVYSNEYQDIGFAFNLHKTKERALAEIVHDGTYIRTVKFVEVVE